jgi:hypothetical protein
VVAGLKVQFKGTGTINGTGNYGFMIAAVDAELTPCTDVDLSRVLLPSFAASQTSDYRHNQKYFFTSWPVL